MRQAAAELESKQRSARARQEAAAVEPVKWFGHTRPPDSVLEELAAEVVMATRPPGPLLAIARGDTNRLAEWLARELPAEEFDPARDHAAVREHAALLLEIEGWHLRHYLGCDEGLRRIRMRAGRLYAMAFAAAAARRGVETIPVYRALAEPIRPGLSWQCVSWHPHAHLADPKYLYRVSVLPSDVVAISVGREVHPIVSVRPDLKWTRVRLPPRSSTQG